MRGRQLDVYVDDGRKSERFGMTDFHFIHFAEWIHRQSRGVNISSESLAMYTKTSAERKNSQSI